ncbi:MAG: hypothetical protein KKC23_00395, partial [Proteobacteria bacterium]|nr:hypothetical protein [Pseudomonadota bacterium]
CHMDRTRKGMAKYPGLLLSNHKPDNSFAMKTGHLEMLLTILNGEICFFAMNQSYGKKKP